MNPQKLVKLSFAALLLLLASCADEDKPQPKKEFAFGDQTISLEDANFFTGYQYPAGKHIYHGYYITDGDTSGNDFTYYVQFELGVPIGKKLSTGVYPTILDWTKTSENSKVGYVYARSGKDEQYVKFNMLGTSDGSDKLVVSGGVNDGQTMAVKFTGNLSYYHFDGTGWVTDTVTCSFYAKGKIQDIDFSPNKKEKAIPGAAGK